MRSYKSMKEALASGRGAERPFNCPEHDDAHASATVNVEKAGSVIRAWRKSLPEQGERIADIDIGDDRLLWAALQGVCFAEAAIRHADGEVAKHLRFTEAFLRSWWKRQQGLKETL